MMYGTIEPFWIKYLLSGYLQFQKTTLSDPGDLFLVCIIMSCHIHVMLCFVTLRVWQFPSVQAFTSLKLMSTVAFSHPKWELLTLQTFRKAFFQLKEGTYEEGYSKTGKRNFSFYHLHLTLFWNHPFPLFTINSGFVPLFHKDVVLNTHLWKYFHQNPGVSTLSEICLSNLSLLEWHVNLLSLVLIIMTPPWDYLELLKLLPYLPLCSFIDSLQFTHVIWCRVQPLEVVQLPLMLIKNPLELDVGVLEIATHFVKGITVGSNTRNGEEE